MNRLPVPIILVGIPLLDNKKEHILFGGINPPTPRGIYQRLQSWQRYNQIPFTEQWDDKDLLAQHMDEYYEKQQRKPLYSFPETYILHTRTGRRRFAQRLLLDDGLDQPWVLKRPTINQGKGVTVLPPNSQKLSNIIQKVERTLFQDPSARIIVQQYICNEMTYEGYKFDFRIFWFVASLDPLLVLYHKTQNYVRIGSSKYDETNFDTQKQQQQHLTTHTFTAQESKLTWKQFESFINSKQEEGILQINNVTITTPFQHVENQIKTIISHLVDAHRNTTFQRHYPDSTTSQNGFALHAADMIIDNDLNVYLVEGTDGPGKDEDYDFRIDMHNQIFGSVWSILFMIYPQSSSNNNNNLRAHKKWISMI